MNRFVTAASVRVAGTAAVLDADWLERMGVKSRPLSVAARYYLMGYGGARYHSEVAYPGGNE